MRRDRAIRRSTSQKNRARHPTTQPPNQTKEHQRMNQLSNTSTDRVRGSALLSDHVHTHGTAFTVEERRQSGLEGLLPHAVETLQRQAERIAQQLDAKLTDLDRY